jgi:hypothetical protein
MDNRNMRETIRATIIALGCLAALLTLAHPVHGLEEPQPSRNPAIVKDQLRQAAALCKRTIREVQALPADDSSPVDPQVHKRARETYILLRAGWWGLSLAQQRETSYKDPMLDLAYKRIDEALPLARFPVDNTNLPRSEYIDKSVQHLSRAIRLINQAVVILP